MRVAFRLPSRAQNPPRSSFISLNSSCESIELTIANCVLTKVISQVTAAKPSTPNEEKVKEFDPADAKSTYKVIDYAVTDEGKKLIVAPCETADCKTVVDQAAIETYSVPQK